MPRGRYKNRNEKRMRSAIALLILIFFLLLFILLFLPPVSLRKQEKKIVQKRETVTREERENVKKREQVGAKKEHPEKKGKLVIIIDDAGYNLKTLRPFLNVPWKITISVLPNLEYSNRAAREILSAGKDLLLHLPMEPENGMNPGPGAIFVGDSRDEIFRKLDKDFGSVAGAVGANNHMGSKATADDRVMNIVMEYFHIHGKYFIDSKTTPSSKAKKYAVKWGVPYLARNIFLDNTPNEKTIEKWVLKGMQIAKKKGYAILIGHVKSPQIIDVLYKMQPVLLSEGFKFSGINGLIENLKNTLKDKKGKEKIKG